MPQAAAGAVIGWLGVSGAAAAVVGAVVQVVVVMAINYGLTRLSQSLAGKPKTSGAGASRDITVRGTVEPMQMIYGEVMAPGFICMYATSGGNNRYLHFVVAYAAHQCEGITDVILDGLTVPDADIDGSGNVSTAAFQGEGESRLQVRRFLGTKNQAADTGLTGAGIGGWTALHRGAGVTYIHYRMDGSEEAFPAGAPSNFRALVKGRRLYDPRLDSTNGGSGSHRYNDATTWAYSNNAALCRRDYITGGSRWYDVATPEPRLGFGESNARINDTFTIAAANIDDEDVAIPGSTTQKRYTCDVQLSCGDTHRENLRVLESASAGTTSYVNGQYRIYSGSYDTPDIELDEDDILGPVTVSTHPQGEDLYNLVTGTFYDEARDWSLSPFPNITNSSYESDDRGQKTRNIELHATRTSYRAQRIGILHLTRSRQKITVRFERLSPKAMAIAENETFTVSISEYGWSSKVFRCIEWEWMPDGFIALTAREESSAAYADPDVGTYAAGEEATVDTPEYDQPDAPINFTVSPTIDGVHASWDAPIPVKRDQTYHVYEHTANTPFSSATRVWSGQATQVTINRLDVVIRYYWVTSELNGLESSAVPVGNGTAGSAFLSGPQRICPDAEVGTSDPTLYWSPGNAKTTVANTGGLVGGIITLAANGSNPIPNISPLRPGGMLQASFGMQVKVRLRYRRTTALSTSSGSHPALQVYLDSWSTSTGGLQSQQDRKAIDLNALTLNVWEESAVTLEVLFNAAAFFGSPRPYINASLYLSAVDLTGIPTGTIEVDLFDAVIL